MTIYENHHVLNNIIWSKIDDNVLYNIFFIIQYLKRYYPVHKYQYLKNKLDQTQLPLKCSVLGASQFGLPRSVSYHVLSRKWASSKSYQEFQVILYNSFPTMYQKGITILFIHSNLKSIVKSSM